MKGTIKNFIESRGFGFILGEDGNEYFFHISNVKNESNPLRGDNVEFIPKETEKGINATAITINRQSVKTRPPFIAFGDYRFKLSNIKDYGIIKNDSITVIKVYELGVANGIFVKNLPVYKWFGKKIQYDGNRRQRIIDENGEVTERENSCYDDDIFSEKDDSLYITTYQGEIYKFFKSYVSFDIYEKFKEIDSYML